MRALTGNEEKKPSHQESRKQKQNHNIPTVLIPVSVCTLFDERKWSVRRLFATLSLLLRSLERKNNALHLDTRQQKIRANHERCEF